MPEISVIVPVYKSEAYLPRCIESILAQTFTDFELILVDDGSPDNCGAICDEYAIRDRRIRVIHKENGGASSARNAGLDVAIGDYIAFIDSDDTVSDAYLEELFQWREFDFVTAGFTWQDDQNNWHVREFEESETTINAIRALPSKYVGKYYFGSPWAKLLKRALIEKNSLRFDSTIHCGEDQLFNYRYVNCSSSMKIIPLCGYFYHYYETSLVHTPHKDVWKWNICVENAMMDVFRNAEEMEHVFLLKREFSMLMDLVDQYDKMGIRNELTKIYTHSFFKECIAYKARYGTPASWDPAHSVLPSAQLSRSPARFLCLPVAATQP